MGHIVKSISLYLDVDGVVCPFGPVGTTDWGTAWQYAGVGLMEVKYAAELVGELNDLSGCAGVRCVWLTSWEELAPKYLCRAIGLDGRKWPVLSSGDQAGGYEWWKLDAIQRDIEKHSPERIVWIDDQLDSEDRAGAWMTILGRRILGVSPDPRRGISLTDILSIKAFLDSGPTEQWQHGER
ncbi:hypothetical protein CVV68_19020 [Arthrobacter livingstonensis]|uniref:Uncharacterized protein n=1 Tax=Arthrobacter livingstonensis TaxID=670078 RepID=A0A2V5LFS2_9MICC|nr:hypothetical protein CVV68_19020 [Arthrobacter livingstonensis]